MGAVDGVCGANELGLIYSNMIPAWGTHGR